MKGPAGNCKKSMTKRSFCRNQTEIGPEWTGEKENWKNVIKSQKKEAICGIVDTDRK